MRTTFCGAAALALCVSAPIGASAAPLNHFFANITPLNDSGVSGRAELIHNTTDNTLTVEINATGLVPGMLHPQHIHGRFQSGFEGAPKNSLVPPPSADDDGDGFVELLEGRDFYGPIILPLTFTNPTEAADADPATAFPLATGGTLSFMETYDLSSAMFGEVPEQPGEFYEAEDLFPLTLREIVLHGGFVPPGVQGTDPDAQGLVYSAVIPVASGDIQAAVTPVPLPAAGWALIAGLGALVGVAKRRKG